jgi:hypothetical protein
MELRCLYCRLKSVELGLRSLCGVTHAMRTCAVSLRSGDDVVHLHPVCVIALIALRPLLICVRINTYIDGLKALLRSRDRPGTAEELVIPLLAIGWILWNASLIQREDSWDSIFKDKNV